MVKYLAFSKGEKKKVGICFYNDLEKFYEFSLIPLSRIKDKVNIYQPNCLLYSGSGGFLINLMDEIKNNFPKLEFIQVGSIANLEKDIIDGIVSVPGLKREHRNYYPEYYFIGKKINNVKKKALLVMYLYKPWQEVSEFKLAEDIPFSPNLLKNIHMTDLSPQVQELNEKLTQMSKLSYLVTLNCQEILFLVEKTRKFAKILDSFYTLKIDEETKEEKENTKINNNEGNE